jgi:hypothetical protein
MRARWVQNYYERPEFPIVQQTLIASWLPWKYFFVSTVQFDASSYLAKITISPETKDNHAEIKGYVTQMFRCDKHGVVRSLNKPLFNNKPLFEREYSDLFKAIDGHKETVKKFARGARIYGPSGNCIE